MGELKKIETSCEKSIADEKTFEEKKALEERSAKVRLQEAVRIDRGIADKYAAAMRSPAGPGSS